MDNLEAGSQMAELIRNNIRQALANGNGIIPGGWLIGYRDPTDEERQFGVFDVTKLAFRDCPEILLLIGQVTEGTTEVLGERPYVALDPQKHANNPIAHVNERMQAIVDPIIKRLTFFTD